MLIRSRRLVLRRRDDGLRRDGGGAGAARGVGDPLGRDGAVAGAGRAGGRRHVRRGGGRAAVRGARHRHARHLDDLRADGVGDARGARRDRAVCCCVLVLLASVTVLIVKKRLWNIYRLRDRVKGMLLTRRSLSGVGVALMGLDRGRRVLPVVARREAVRGDRRHRLDRSLRRRGSQAGGGQQPGDAGEQSTGREHIVG